MEYEVLERAGADGDFNAVVGALLRRGMDAEVDEALTAEELREIEEGIDRGEADCAAGRVRPAEEFFAYMKAKYGIE